LFHAASSDFMLSGASIVLSPWTKSHLFYR
jgi:hypothetical protein